MASNQRSPMRIRRGQNQEDVSQLFGALSVRGAQPNEPAATAPTNVPKGLNENVPVSVSKSIVDSTPEMVMPERGTLLSTGSTGSVVDLARGTRVSAKSEPKRLFGEAEAEAAGNGRQNIAGTGSRVVVDMGSENLAPSPDTPVGQQCTEIDPSCRLDYQPEHMGPWSTAEPVSDSESQKRSIELPVFDFGKSSENKSQASSSSSFKSLTTSDSNPKEQDDEAEEVQHIHSEGGMQFSRENTGAVEKYLMKIIEQPFDFGIYVWSGMKPVSVGGVMRYRQNMEFSCERIHGRKDSDLGVFVCTDKKTGEKFILKKIQKENKRLIGIEFITKHSHQNFLPKIYGIYKEERTLSIYQEYIGGALWQCNWNFREIRCFAHVLLEAFKYLHINGLVHGDVKMHNLMVRDPANPCSLVVIDLEAAKHPQYPFVPGGHTVSYLPQWHDKILKLTKYDPVLKTADLWGIACVLIFFLLPGDRSDVQRDEVGIWKKALADIRAQCRWCKDYKKGSTCCEQCKNNLKDHITMKGKDILQHHLGRMMEMPNDDPDWQVLQRVLVYLTCTDDIEKKTVEIALQILQGPCHVATPQAIDYNVH